MTGLHWRQQAWHQRITSSANETLDVYVASTHDPGRLSRFKTAASRQGLRLDPRLLVRGSKKASTQKLANFWLTKSTRSKRDAANARSKPPSTRETFSQVTLEYYDRARGGMVPEASLRFSRLVRAA
jgi:hypothetical protein